MRISPSAWMVADASHGKPQVQFGHDDLAVMTRVLDRLGSGEDETLYLTSCAAVSM